LALGVGDDVVDTQGVVSRGLSAVASDSMKMACSGHDWAASRTASSCSGGTTSETGDDVPSMSLSSKDSGAIIAHSVWPWHRSESTLTFMNFPSRIRRSPRTVLGGRGSDVVVVPLEVAAGVHPQLH